MTLDINTHEVVWGRKRQHLSPQEFTIAKLLFEAPGRIVEHRRVTDALYGHRYDGGAEDPDQIRKVLMCILRRKLRSIGWPGHIATVWAVGYRAVPPIRLSRANMKEAS